MGMYYEKGGVCPDNAAPGNAAGAQCVGGKGEGGEAGEQQIRAPGNPYSSFSSSSLSLCIRRGFKISLMKQREIRRKKVSPPTPILSKMHERLGSTV